MNSVATPATRVLVADDNAVDRTLLATIVGRAGFDVIQAVDGIDAIEKFYAEKPDMVLLDALMPGKDGFTVAEEIKANSGDDFVPIIFLTSLTEATDLARCIDAGGDDFLSKPYNRIILQAKLYAMQRMRNMQQVVQAQRDEISRHHTQLIADQQAAKSVYDTVASSQDLEASYIQYLISPLSLFNGDALLAAHNPSGTLFVLLGDFTGHGLAAAIGAIPLADVFYGMTAKGFSLSEVVRECNRKLNSVLPPGYFCCAAVLAVDFKRHSVEYWNGALPSVYLRRHEDDEVVPLASANLPLGILANERFCDNTMVHEIEHGDRLLMATDGLIEARNVYGDMFGAERLMELVARTPVDRLFQRIHDDVQQFTADTEGDDDLAMVEIAVVPESEIEHVDIHESLEDLGGPQEWKFSYELGSASLKEFNPLPLLQQVLMEVPYLRAKSSAIYTVMAELYSNALEHGVLELDSNLKSSAEGFAQYYEMRAKALEKVSGYIRFDIQGHMCGTSIDLRIEVTDSGAGFNSETYLKKARAHAANGSYHGRGVNLLLCLCEEVIFYDPGNRVGVVMEWEHGDE